MSTAALALREAIYTRLKARPNYNSRYRNPMPMTQPDELPSLRVIIAGEDMTPDGDANHGEIAFVTEVTIAITVLGKGKESAPAEYDVDLEMSEIESLLFGDPTFTKFGPDALFEGISRVRRTRIFPREGETFFAGVRTDITFVTRAAFPARVEDDFSTITFRHDVPAGTPQGGFDHTFPTEE
jgi:hypothetical protein